MARLTQVQPIDGYAESTDSYGQAIGLANDAIGSVLTLYPNREIVSGFSTSLATYVNGNNETVYVAYISGLITTYDV